MQHVLPHKALTNKCQRRKTQTSDKHSAKALHIAGQNPLPPERWQPLQLIEIVQDLAYLPRRAFLFPKPGPQVRLEDVLVDGRRNADAEGLAGGAERIVGRGDDCLVFVPHGGDIGEEVHNHDAPIAKPDHEQENHGRPLGREQAESREQAAGKEKDCRDGQAKGDVLARELHDVSRQERADGNADRVWDQPNAGGGGGEAADLEPDGTVEQNGEDDHHCEPVVQASGGDGAVEHQLKRDNGFGCPSAFDPSESAQTGGGQRQRAGNEGMAPRNHVSAQVQAHQQQEQRGCECKGAEEIDSRKLGLAGWLGGNVHENVHEDCRHQSRRHLGEEGNSPTPDIVSPAAKESSQATADTKRRVAQALYQTSPPQRHKIRGDKVADGHQSSST